MQDAISEYSKKSADVRRLTNMVASLTSCCDELESRLNDWENLSEISASSVKLGHVKHKLSKCVEELITLIPRGGRLRHHNNCRQSIVCCFHQSAAAMLRFTEIAKALDC